MNSGLRENAGVVSRTQDDMVAEAERAGLTYVDSEDDGYLRRELEEGFEYLKGNGSPLVSKGIIARIEALAIPPNWHDVWICKRSDGHIQATGRDDAERKQYIYHDAWAAHRARSRRANILEFGRRLPALRERIDRDLRRRALDLQRVCAIACAILDRTWMRIGQEYYDRESGTHGLTTLTKEEVHIGSQRVEMTYVGKGGAERSVTFSDRRIASQLRRVAELPGTRLMQYERDGEVFGLSAHQVNEYIQTHAGKAFSAKDFRTWGGTVQCMETLAQNPSPEEVRACQKRLVEAVKATSERLGNTPAVSRNHYIHIDLLRLGEEVELWPRILEKLDGEASGDARLHQSERRLVTVLGALSDLVH